MEAKRWRKMYATRRRRQRRAVRVRRSVRTKVRKLQRLVPGGEGLRPDRLFWRTAVYIMYLRSQVDALQALNNFYRP